MNFITEKVRVWQTTEVQIPTALPPGQYEIEVRAIDEFGIQSAPVKVKVTVKSPPKVKLISPLDGAVVSQTPTIVLRAEDTLDCEVKFIVSITPIPSPERGTSPPEGEEGETAGGDDTENEETSTENTKTEHQIVIVDETRVTSSEGDVKFFRGKGE